MILESINRDGDIISIAGIQHTEQQARQIYNAIGKLLKKKKNIIQFTEDSIPYRLSRKYFLIISSRNKEIKEPDLQKWARSVDLMIRQDGRKDMEIYQKMVAVQNDEFWQNNCLSVDKLRQRWNEGKLERINKTTSDDIPSVRYGGM